MRLIARRRCTRQIGHGAGGRTRRVDMKEEMKDSKEGELKEVRSKLK
jgi:hypothetical protein